MAELKAAGELDDVIAGLSQLATSYPKDASIPTAIGEAMLNKFPVQDPNEAARLGMQIDQSFDAALALDPTNWEAQFYKADSMSYWPPEMNRGPEVIQNLSNLVTQQEAAAQQPQFAQTYTLLGDQYQKAEETGQAQSTWEKGLEKFPTDPELRARVGNSAGR